MSTVFTVIGAAVVLWWLAGLALVAFFCQHYVEPEAPLSARMQTLFSAAFHMPWFALVNGSLPIILLMPSEPTPEQEAKFEKWRLDNCNCPACKARRGER